MINTFEEECNRKESNSIELNKSRYTLMGVISRNKYKNYVELLLAREIWDSIMINYERNDYVQQSKATTHKIV